MKGIALRANAADAQRTPGACAEQHAHGGDMGYFDADGKVAAAGQRAGLAATDACRIRGETYEPRSAEGWI